MKTWKLADLPNMAGDPDAQRFLTGVSPGTAARRLGVTRMHVHRLIKERKLDAVRIVNARRELCAICIAVDSLVRFELRRTEAA